MGTRARWWMAGTVAVLALGGCRRANPPDRGVPPPREDVSELGRAGMPEHQGAVPTGESGEGKGTPGEQSAVKELPVGQPINVGTPGENSTEQRKK